MKQFNWLLHKITNVQRKRNRAGLEGSKEKGGRIKREVRHTEIHQSFMQMIRETLRSC